MKMKPLRQQGHEAKVAKVAKVAKEEASVEALVAPAKVCYHNMQRELSLLNRRPFPVFTL